MVVEKPKIISDSYKGDSGKDKAKFYTPKQFRFTSTQKERVRDALEQNAILESSPTRRTLRNKTSEEMMNLRPREEHKELCGLFRFKPTTTERIAEGIAIHNRTKMPKSIIESQDVRRSNDKLRTSGDKAMRIVDMKDSQLSKPKFGSILTARHSPSIESKLRASSTSRAQGNFSRETNDSKVNIRHQTVQPFNKSLYSRTKNGMHQEKTFFKGAVGVLQAVRNSTLNDKDESLKLILDE